MVLVFDMNGLPDSGAVPAASAPRLTQRASEGMVGPLARAGVFMTPEAALGSAIVEVVRQLLQHELTARLAALREGPRSPWMTPPSASRASGVPVKSIRAWVRAGSIPKRLRNASTDPKQQKYLVNIEDVVARAEQRADVGAVADGDRARIRAREILAAREMKGR